MKHVPIVPIGPNVLTPLPSFPDLGNEVEYDPDCAIEPDWDDYGHGDMRRLIED